MFQCIVDAVHKFRSQCVVNGGRQAEEKIMAYTSLLNLHDARCSSATPDAIKEWSVQQSLLITK